MPWSRSRPAQAKYRTKEHTDTRKRLMAQLRHDGHGLCAEAVCVYPSRLITPDMPLHLCHTTDGTAIRGLGHAKCNISAAAHEANRRQKQRRATNTAEPSTYHSPIW